MDKGDGPKKALEDTHAIKMQLTMTQVNLLLSKLLNKQFRFFKKGKPLSLMFFAPLIADKNKKGILGER